MDDDALNQVINDLMNSDPEIRLVAVRSLMESPTVDERLAATLHMLLADNDVSIRNLADQVLQRIDIDHTLEVGAADKKLRPVLSQQVKSQRAIDSLFWELGNSDPEVREEAAAALAAQSHGEVAHALVKALEGDTLATIRLRELRDPRIIHPLLRAHVYGGLATATACLIELGELAVPSLIERLHHPETIVRAGVPILLAHIGMDSAIDPLIERFHEDREGVVRSAIVEALGYFDAPDVIETLLEILSSPDPELQADAARALGRLREPSAIDRILTLLNSPEEIVRVAAAESLGSLGSDRAVEPLIIVLHNERGTVREAACAALEKLTNSHLGSLLAQLFQGKHGVAAQVAALNMACAINPLHWMLIEGEPVARAECARALASFDPHRVFQLLVDSLSDEDASVGEAVRDALVRVGGVAVDALCELTRHPEERVRRLVLESLGRIGDSRGVPSAIGCLHDGNASVRAAAIEALGKMGDSSAAEPLIELLADVIRNDPNPQIVAASLQTIGHLKSPQAFEPLIHSLENGEAAIRIAAIEGLSALGDTRAIRPLKAIASILNRKENPVVKGAAKEAVRKLESSV